MTIFLQRMITSSPFNLSLAMLIVGSSVVCGKLLTQEIPLFLASEIRFILASLLFLPIGIYRRELFQISRHDWLILVAMAFCGQVLFTIMLLLGLRYTSGINAGTLTSTTPFFMALIARFCLGERYQKIQLLALLLSLSSILLINYEALAELTTSSASQLWGNLLIIGAVLGESCFLLLGKKLHGQISGLELTALLSLLGAVICLPPALTEAMDFAFFALTATDIVAMLYLGWIYTNLAYLCWFHGLKGSSGANAGIYTALMPISASCFSLLLMDERMNFYQGAALLLSVSSILLSTVYMRKKDHATK